MMREERKLGAGDGDEMDHDSGGSGTGDRNDLGGKG
jgi:hypothetical protein